MTTTNRVASCSCAELRMTVEGDPTRVSICHCLDCQKRTGSAFGVQARFARDRVRTVDGQSARYVRVSDAGNRVTFHFCSACGSTVYWEPEALPGFVVIAVGAFAEPSFPAPTVSVYEARAHAWALAPGELALEHMD